MAGELQPTEGSIARNRKIVIGRFTQHFVDKLDMSKNPIEYLLSKFPEFKPEEMRKRLGRFGLTGNNFFFFLFYYILFFLFFIFIF